MSYEKVSKAKQIVVGTKQTVKAIQKGNVVGVFVANDADQLIVNPVVNAATHHDVPIEYVQSKNELGKACGIDVMASAVGIIREK